MTKKNPKNPKESVGVGNTNQPPAPIKKESQAKHWCFTFNNYDEIDYHHLIERLSVSCSKYVIGKEVGESGTPHLQGYCEFTIKKSLTYIKRNITQCDKIHWEIARNINASIEYCKKDNKYITFGFPKEIQIITKLRPWQESIEAIVLEGADDRKINWFWEETGNVGKSSLCKYLYVKYKCLIIQGGNHADIINGIFNYNMDDCKAVIIDIPRCHKGGVSYSAIECIKNGMIFNTKYETGVKVFNNVHVIIFSNFEPTEKDMEKLSEDRWNIKHINSIIATEKEKAIFLEFN